MHKYHSGNRGSDMRGRPKESGSRQQTHHRQGSQTGSPKLDRELTRPGGSEPGAKPASAK
jgi:hypothetical protein